MRKSKIYNALNDLNVYDLNRFRKYLTSPYFNQREEIVTLFDILSEDIRSSIQTKNFSRESIFAQLYKEIEYDDVKLRRLLNHLVTHLQNFIACSRFLDDSLQQANNLLGAVYERNLKSLYSSSIRQAERQSERNLTKSGSYYHAQFELQSHLYDLTGYEIKRDARSNLEEIDAYLNAFFIIEKLRNYCNMMARKSYRDFEYQTLFIEEIISHVEKHNYDHIPAIQVYYRVYALLTVEGNGDDAYYELKETVYKNIDIFSQSEALDLNHILINHCIKRIHQGALNFNREMFNVYKLGLEKELLIVQNRLSTMDYKNIVLLGLRLQEFEWVSGFIDHYIQYIAEESRENARIFNRARYHFYNKEYSEVLPLLAQVEFEDFSYNLASKAMLLATYYETDEYDALISFMDSFRTFLNRNKKKLKADRRERYIKTITYVKKLVHATPGDDSKLNKIEEDLENEENIADIRWLKEKIDELR